MERMDRRKLIEETADRMLKNVRSIRNIKQLSEPCECGNARLLIEFSDGKKIVTHNDDSLFDYLGETE